MRRELTLPVQDNMADLARVIGECNDFFEAGSLPASILYRVNLVLEEILTNIVKYAFDDRLPHEITLWIGLSDTELRLRFTDNGREFDPTLAPPPEMKTDILECKEGGLGIHLVRQHADSLRYSRQEGRNVLTAGFGLEAFRSSIP
ncbi:MAG: ATP-binding protein [Thermodesulfobacteriota bacterium]